MTTDHAKTVIGTRLELARAVPVDVECNNDIPLIVRVICSGPCDLSEALVHVVSGEVVVASARFKQLAPDYGETGTLIIPGPTEEGPCHWSVVLPGQDAGEEHQLSGDTLSIEARAVAFRHEVTVWDVPDVLPRGSDFSIKGGVRLPSGFPTDDIVLVVRDDAGTEMGSARLQPEPWSGTRALRWGEIALTAPAGEGRYTWALSVSGVEGVAEIERTFSLNVLSPPDIAVTATIRNARTGEPVEGAVLRVGPFRSSTGADGVATVTVTAGQHAVSVWKSGYEPYRQDADIRAPQQIEVPLAPEATEDDPHFWM